MPQGTIKTYDEQSRSGVILDDQRTELPFDAESFRASGIRLFRLGQRVKFRLEGEGARRKVRDLTIVTL
jgi:2-phospho-L-lactate/phosphoenolpyruvate guanylyltransferase